MLPWIVLDASGKGVAATARESTPPEECIANAALIVAAVNAEWERERRIARMNQAMVEAVCVTPDCALPAGHHGACTPIRPHAHREGKFYTLDGPPTPGFTPICALPANHSGPCLPERSEPLPERFTCAEPGCTLPWRHEGACEEFFDPALARAAEQEHQRRRAVEGSLRPSARQCSHGQVSLDSLEVDARYEFPARMVTEGGPTVRRSDAEPPSADCRLPLLHDRGCICRRLLEP